MFSSQRPESVTMTRPVTSANVNLELHQYMSSFKTNTVKKCLSLS